MSEFDGRTSGPGDTRKIGEVSRASGVSVRMLRHYDEIGLLRPSGHTDGGHREYSAEDGLRLEAIVALRAAGFSLPNIQELLDANAHPRKLVHAQIVAVEESLALLQAARARLILLEDRLQRGEPARLDQALELAGLMNRASRPLSREGLEALVASRQAAVASMTRRERQEMEANRRALIERLGPAGEQALRQARSRFVEGESRGE